ncbi:sterol desaturase family protein [Pseudomonas sp. LFM046]|uniref:sterol desaturase family protein n=1 Tax=Pseudomonas sp. LFM046 TaxID=1608357 RepID=UPI0005CFC3E4|nr:sterol desaturase family protein [Pseudomonas sp. LFM046]
MEEFIQWAKVILESNLKTLAIVASISGVCWLIESCRPSTVDVGLKGRWHNLCVFTYLLIGMVISAPFITWYSQLLPSVALIDQVFPGWRSEGLLGAVVATVIYALVWDFFQYWTHRLEHKFSVLWKFHRIHHSDAHMNSTTSLRQSVGGALLGFMFTHIPTIAVCGGGMLPYLGSLILFSCWGYFNHANLRVSLGVMTFVLSGPQLHRLHHGRDCSYHNCNYAAFFPFLDYIFGTLRAPEGNEWVETGIDNDRSPQTPFRQSFLSWLDEKPASSETLRVSDGHLSQGS